MTRTKTTEEQFAAICHRAYNSTTRAIERTGIVLTIEQADELGESGMDWLRKRLGLRIDTSDDEIVRCVSAVTTPECARCGGSRYNLGQCTTCGLAPDEAEHDDEH